MNDKLNIGESGLNRNPLCVFVNIIAKKKDIKKEAK